MGVHLAGHKPGYAPNYLGVAERADETSLDYLPVGLICHF
jgi:hypothetical protein